MSNNESFIDEVNEEVQRDRLFQLMRKYGWIGVLIVLLLVGGAAWNEWRKASERAEAEALGDAFLAALSEDAPEARAEALAAVEAEGQAVVLRDLMRASEMSEAGDKAGAAELLDAVGGRAGIDPVYGDLARLKAVMLGVAPPEERLAALEPLASPGAPYRLLALEQMAIAEAEAGNAEAAIGIAETIVEDAQVGRGLRERAQNLIVALGGSVPGDAAETETEATGIAAETE